MKGDVNSVKNSNFNSNKNTIFVVHGWNGNGYNDLNEALTEGKNLYVKKTEFSSILGLTILPQAFDQGRKIYALGYCHQIKYR